MKNRNKLRLSIIFVLVVPGLMSVNIIAEEQNDQSQEATRGCDDCGRKCECKCKCCDTCGKDCKCGKCCNSCGKSCKYCCKKSHDESDDCSTK